MVITNRSLCGFGICFAAYNTISVTCVYARSPSTARQDSKLTGERTWNLITYTACYTVICAARSARFESAGSGASRSMCHRIAHRNAIVPNTMSDAKCDYFLQLLSTIDIICKSLFFFLSHLIAYRYKYNSLKRNDIHSCKCKGIS